MTNQTDQERAELIDKIMEQAQVFASAWSLVGGPFDFGNAMHDAEEAKEELRGIVSSLLAADKAVGGPTQRQYDTAMRQWEHWKTYALELRARLVKHEGGSPMILNTHPQPSALPDDVVKDAVIKYHELLYAVGMKHPGETRHETALRYIRNAEQNNCGSQAIDAAMLKE